MNWEAAGAIGEIVGALGVLITLAYIAIQVRSTNRLLLMQHRETNRAAQYDIDQRIIDDREFGELLIKAEEAYGELQEIDRRRVSSHLNNVFIHRHNMYLRGKLLNDERVMNVAVATAADLVARNLWMREDLNDGAWDHSFTQGVIRKLGEGA